MCLGGPDTDIPEDTSSVSMQDEFAYSSVDYSSMMLSDMRGFSRFPET